MNTTPSPIVVYTFRSVNFTDELREKHDQLFILDSLKEDFGKLANIIAKQRPTAILGIGNGNNTCYEPITINQFNKTKSVIKDAPTSYLLDELSNILPASPQPTDSYCNWTMYRLAHLLATKQIDSKHYFIHINRHNISQALRAIDQLLLFLEK